jgi:inhibitor of KinA
MLVWEPRMKWIPYGPNAWLLQFAESIGDEAFARGQAIMTELEREPPPHLAEIVPSFTTILLEFAWNASVSPNSWLEPLTKRLESAVAAPIPIGPVKQIPITYDGPDLERIARHHNLPMEDVCRRHSAPIYKVYLLGFAPGFPYLGDLDPRLHTPRLPSPRPRVAAGSVAIGGVHTGIYSVDSPGGWNIIGQTAAKLFDPSRGDGEEMFLLKRGDRVKFIPQNLP